jgi:deazaflavin-dependent oxidoreductase (nitroreductase family)
LFGLPLVLPRVVARTLATALSIDWIVVTTRGRRTGKPHTVVLDVVGYDAVTKTWYVQPAYGYESDWVRNVLANPSVEVEIDGRRSRGRVVEVTGSDGAEVVLRFIRSHPLYARLVVWMVGYVERIDLPDDELRAKLLATPVFAIHPE